MTMTRQQLVELARREGATLNGRPASVSGYKNDFATVTDRETRMSVEFAWQTVERILTTHKGFKS